MIDLIISALLILPIYLGVALIFFGILRHEQDDRERAHSALMAAGFFLYAFCFIGWAAGCVCPV